MTYKDIYSKARLMLKDADIFEYDNDAFELLSFCFNINKSDYILNSQREVEEEECNRFIELIKKRCNKIPLQYITGVQNFYGLDIKVNENVLIPRYDTEVLVEWILESEKNESCSVLDMCSGSGCISLALKSKRQSWEVCGADISAEAVKTAHSNSLNLGLKVDYIESDLFLAFSDIDKSFDVIVSNPPYIRTDDIDELMVEVKSHEPMLALDGGKDGLMFYERITREAVKYLNKNGCLYYEIGHDEADDVCNILKKYGFTNVEVKKDLAMLDRCVRGYLL